MPSGGKNNPRALLPVLNALLVLMVFVVLLMAASGCGDSAPTVTGVQTEKPVTTKTYSTDPVDTGLLLRDTSETIQTMTAADAGVHFTMEKYDSTAGASKYSLGEGDMAAGRAKMKTRNSIGGEPTKAELIAVGGQTYTRTESGIWQASSQGLIAPELESLVDYLDLARSSRNFGQETLGDGRKTFHVQVDVDSTLAFESAKKRTNDPATQLSLEAMKSAALTVDLWIGWDDQLVYQQKTVVTGTLDMPGSETTYLYSKWGEPVDITRPCEAC